MRKLAIILLALLSFSVRAWDTNDFKEESLSPITTSARNVVMVSTGLTVGLIFFENSIIDPTQKSFVDHKPLGSLSKTGDLMGKMVPNALYAIGMGLDGLSGNNIGYQRALGMFKASAYAGVVTTALKHTARERRPVGNSYERNSFPSSHATNAFAFAGYVFEEHGIVWGAPSLLLATFVGLSRVNDNRHFIHDVIAGAGIGLAYGIGISKTDRLKKERDEIKAGLMVYPIFDRETKGLAMIYEF